MSKNDSFNAHSKRTAEMLLFTAAREGNLPSLAKALQQGANINAQNERGETALIVAVKNDHVEYAKVLVALRADLTIRDIDGKTARDHSSTNRTLCSFKQIGLSASSPQYQQITERLAVLRQMDDLLIGAEHEAMSARMPNRQKPAGVDPSQIKYKV